MTSRATGEEPGASGGRAALLRAAAVFQAKLFVDGLRDLVMSPVSLLMAAIDFVFGGDRFYRLILLGRRTERWINLFGTHGRTGLDDAVARIERTLAEQYRRGDLPASARDSVSAALDLVRRSRARESGPDAANGR